MAEDPAEPTAAEAISGRGLVVASAGLIVCVICAGLAGFLLLGRAEGCQPGDAALICTARGQRIASEVPTGGSVVAAALALTGAWLWPRRAQRIWLSLGYAGVAASALAGLVAACS
jgi:hypothetical protein